MPDAAFPFAVTDGWLRDLASEPTPGDAWPCIRWDEPLLRDQVRFLDVQVEVGVRYNVVWGLFVARRWPAPLVDVIDPERVALLHAFIDAAHARGVKVLSGLGVYSWGFDEVIERHPEVSAGGSQVMCPFREAAWDWQRRVLDFLMEPRWDLDGVSMQSADLGRCECERCSRLSHAEHHALILCRSADYIRSQRPGWVIGQASWGLRVDEPSELDHLVRISQSVDYMVEVRERSAAVGRRRELCQALDCAFGSVGGVFVEPPQHWDRLRWCVPCGLRSAQALQRLRQDGGRACEYFYRPFANPTEEVSWRTGARVLASPDTPPETALREAVAAVYGAHESILDWLTDWFTAVEDAYFERTDFEVGSGPLSLEPLMWGEDPSAPGPPVYLRDRMSPGARRDYARELDRLQEQFQDMAGALPNGDAASRTVACLSGTLRELAAME